MNEPETRMILAQASALDNRQITDAMILIWYKAFQGYTYDEVSWAFDEHVRTSTEYLVPARLITLINAKRHEYRMANPSAPVESDTWLEFERMELAAAREAKAIRATGARYAVEAIDAIDPDPKGIES